MLLSTTEALSQSDAQTASVLGASPVQFAPQHRRQDIFKQDHKHVNHNNTSWMFAALCTMLVVLTALGIYGQREAYKQSINPSWVLTTHHILSQVTALRATMVDVETSHHGYILNGNQTFIDAFYDAVGQLGTQYHALRLLVQSQPEHRDRVDSLGPLLAARITYAIDDFETRRAQELTSAQALGVRSEEKQLDDNLRAALDQINVAEEALVSAHQQTAEHNVQRAYKMGVFGFIAAFAGSAIALCALWYQIHKRSKRELHMIYSKEEYTRDGDKHAIFRHGSEHRLHDIVSGSGVGVWEWNLDTNEVQFSKEWKRQLGYAENEIRDHFDEWQKRVHPDDIEHALAITHRFIKAPWPNYETEFRMRHKDGSWRWILARACLISGSEGKPMQMVGIHLDITERKHMSEALCPNHAQPAALVSGSVTYPHSVEY